VYVAVDVDVPAGVVTVTLTAPVPAGAMARIVESFETKNDDAGVVPNMTLVAPVKALPLMVRKVPPAAGPVFGLSPLTTGSTG
jgi:hypothetical protein